MSLYSFTTDVANTSIGTVAGTITALASVLTAAGLLVTALTIFLPILRGTKANKVAIAEVHTIVNQQRTDMQRYQAALKMALEKAGVEIPVDQSLEVAPPVTPPS